MLFYRLKNKVRQLSYKYNFVKNMYITLNKIKVNSLANLSDENFAKLKYKENTGNTLNIKNPTTFNEKLWWLKLNNRDPLLTECSDKVEVRQYIKNLGLQQILIPLIGVYDSAQDIDFNKLPPKAFIKTNHGSGINVLWDSQKSFDTKKFQMRFNAALKANYYLQSREWNYKGIKPKLIVEEVLEDKDNYSLIDYRFLCFDGKVKMVFIDTETAAEDGSHNPYAKRNVYDKDFNYLDIKVARDHFDRNLISKPINYKKMLDYAELISKPFVFARVDLYNISGQIYFGEITFYPGGCTQLFEPEQWEYRVGEWIDLGNEKIQL